MNKSMTCLGPPVLASRDRIEIYRRDGLWGQSSLPAIFRRYVEQRPDAPALSDRPSDPTGGRRLTYAEADREMRRLAARFDGFGLTPGDVVAMQIPPTVEAALAMLACMGLGYIVCPLPMAWRRLEIERSLSYLGARAIITWDDDGEYEHVAAACTAAFGVPSIRFVFGFCAEPPDGVTPLPRAGSDDPQAPPPHDGLPVEADPNALALVTWDFVGSGPRALARSHNEWIAASTSILFEAQLGDGASILSPYALSGLAGLAGAFVPWLMTGGHLTLHRPHNLETWRAELAACAADLALIPAALAPAFFPSMPSEGTPPRIVGLVGEPADRADFSGLSHPRLISLHGLGEVALLARRLDGQDADLARGTVPIGPVHAGGAAGPVVFETRLGPSGESGRGEIEICGAPVPSAILMRERTSGFQATSDSGGFLPTGLCAAPDPRDATRALPTGAPAGVIRHGAAAMSLEELDELYASLDVVSDAVVVPISDRVMGQRLVAAIVPAPGESVTLDDVSAELRSRGAALYKFPDRLVVLDRIPRTVDGIVERDRILAAG